MKISPMIVEAQTVRFDSLSLDSGATLAPVEVAYETYGELNAAKSNAILVLHAFSGDAHAAGISHETGKPGWWDNMIGPGKAFDTNKYFVICSQRAGRLPRHHRARPPSIPATGCPYAHVVPGDHHRRHGAAAEDADRPARHPAAAGGDRAARWAACRRSNGRWRIRTAWSPPSPSPPPRATARSRSRSTKWAARPSWPTRTGTSGDYYGKQPPARGLAVARMVGHITYMSDDSMREKFGRRLRGKENFGFDFDVDFEVESYLRYRGSQFVDRFDANSYLYITKAMDYFDLTNGHGSLAAALERGAGALPGDQLQLGLAVPQLPVAGNRARAARRAIATWLTCELQSNYGHDSFLVDVAEQTDLVRGFLASTFEKARMTAAGRPEAGHSSASCWGAAITPSSARSWSPDTQGARPGLRRRRTAGMAGGRTRAWRRAAWRSRARRCSAPSPAASRCSRAISTRGWPTIPTRPSIT